MQTQLRQFGCSQGSRLVPSGSSRSIAAHAKRKGVSKELQELQQLKAQPAPAPQPAPSAPPPAPPSSSLPQSPAVGGPSAALTTPSAPSTSSPSPPDAGPSATSYISNNNPTSSGSGLLDNLQVRILGSVTAIMAVISIFYSIVFYGASNAVYVFKDQLAAITKKDFVPYSERRHMEQEVLAKLEADQAARRLAVGRDVSGGAADSDTTGRTEDPASAVVEPDQGGSELLNLLPGSGGKK